VRPLGICPDWKNAHQVKLERQSEIMGQKPGFNKFEFLLMTYRNPETLTVPVMI
jgi:hypothetical protein